MKQINDIFQEIKGENKKAIIPFISIGSNSLYETIEIAKSIEKAGASILELGIPYSDPIAHERVVQDAYYKALLSGVKFNDCIKIIDEITSKLNIPVIISVYYNLIYCKGIKYFIEEISKINVKGIIVPDIPLEEKEQLFNECKEYNIALIPIVAITSKERIKKITQGGTGFVNCLYQLNSDEKNSLERLEEYLREVRSYTEMPICIDLNPLIKENSYKIREYYDGIRITSEVVKIMNSEKNFNIRKKEVINLISNV
ncbi:MAG: tryptophan synthase subunit alpha [Clostridium sp.]|nr:tryptophan synthase subunit alpha [Clostridium sp.]